MPELSEIEGPNLIINWSEIRAFPGYSVSDQGDVRNDRTGRFLVQVMNQRGMPFVGLSKNGEQYKRAVSILVARAFLPQPTLRSFCVTINLNGDHSDNRACNLQWRPLWFARKYNRQFNEMGVVISPPIINITTGERFESSWDAAMKYGLLEREIMNSILNHTYSWPTFHTFKML